VERHLLVEIALDPAPEDERPEPVCEGQEPDHRAHGCHAGWSTRAMARLTR
jgi:hypothetical protein